MLVYICEYLTSGAWPHDQLLPASLVREGRAMLEAVVSDFLDIPGTRVCVTWDSRLPKPCPAHSRRDLIDIQEVERGKLFTGIFTQACDEADQVLIIAPESDLQLLKLLQLQHPWQLNCDLDGVFVCSHKFSTFDLLYANRILTIPTLLFGKGNSFGRNEQGDIESTVPEWTDMVLKLETGAGSQDMRRVRGPVSQLTRPDDRAWIVQPYIPGRALSVAAIFDDNSQLRQIWPVAEQHLSDDDTFQYQGGCIPAPSVSQPQVDQIVRQVATAIPGLRGYVGIDLILQENGELLVVEINPRLTTSYVGYRALAGRSLAPWLDPRNIPESYPPFAGFVRFDSAGMCWS